MRTTGRLTWTRVTFTLKPACNYFKISSPAETRAPRLRLSRKMSTLKLTKPLVSVRLRNLSGRQLFRQVRQLRLPGRSIGTALNLRLKPRFPFHRMGSTIVTPSAGPLLSGLQARARNKKGCMRNRCVRSKLLVRPSPKWLAPVCTRLRTLCPSWPNTSEA